MVEPISGIFGLIYQALIAAAKVLVAIITVLLTFGQIVDWFRNRQELVASDKDNIAVTLKTKLESGDFRMVQGIFNKRTNKTIDAKVIQCSDIDGKLKKIHDNRELAVYT